MVRRLLTQALPQSFDGCALEWGTSNEGLVYAFPPRSKTVLESGTGLEDRRRRSAPLSTNVRHGVALLPSPAPRLRRRPHFWTRLVLAAGSQPKRHSKAPLGRPGTRPSFLRYRSAEQPKSPFGSRRKGRTLAPELRVPLPSGARFARSSRRRRC